jgi:proteasome lid subunit RPN8/RPN11
MRNVAANPTTRYRIDDRAHIDLRRLLRRIDPALRIVGVYHSHPETDPVPSPTDTAEGMYPEWAHVIVGLRDRRARLAAFRIAGGLAREIQVR